MLDIFIDDLFNSLTDLIVGQNNNNTIRTVQGVRMSTIWIMLSKFCTRKSECGTMSDAIRIFGLVTTVPDFLILLCHINLFDQTFSIDLGNEHCVDST